MLLTERSDCLNRLAWIAQIDPFTLNVKVYCGKDVEVGKNFIVEGVWDGDFSEGNFDASKHFFGSGLKLHNDSILVVPSTALVDRILVCQHQNIYFASNSLTLIMSYLNLDINEDHNYKIQASTILKGIEDYNPEIPVQHPEIKNIYQYYYTPIAINERGLHKQTRTSTPAFKSYNQYKLQLENDLDLITKNSKCKKRKKPIQAYTTISRGYDSVAVSSLTSKHDIICAFTKKRSSSSIISSIYPKASIDNGDIIASYLGLTTEYLDTKNKDIDKEELFYFSPSSAEPEIAFFRIGKHLEKSEMPGLIFTGYHGDKVWDKNLAPHYRDMSIKRGDTSGLNLSEIRLKSGFINVAVPFMYADRVCDLFEISNSQEMSNWSIGGSYDRPIPRRIAEDAGVPRSLFGQRKKAIIDFYNLPKSKILREEFYDHLKSNFSINKYRAIFSELFDTIKYITHRIIYSISQVTKIGKGRIDHPLTQSSLDLPYKLHLWALRKQIEEQKKLLDFKF